MNRILEDFVTCGQMKVLEQRADENGLSYYQMMENAGTCAAQAIMERFSYHRALGEDSSEKMKTSAAVAENNVIDLAAEGEAIGSKGSVMVFCGKGNNGGDGFVVARLMCNAGYDVTVLLVDGEPKTADSIANFNLIKDMPVRIMDMSVNDRILMEIKQDPDIIVDAIYGTGFHGKLRNNALRAAIYINNHFKGTDHVLLLKPAMVAALDIPSGLRGDMTNEKELEQRSVKAHFTITFHAKKPVHLQSFAKEYCGEVIVADIGIDTQKLWNA